ncbi:glutamate receptor 2.7-like [Triticum dicoccoides]|uniref:glutamate receptor 2.7-like n=1 Tax=Triticum dicoccoides TaxID=85692 RepID=UPI0018916FB5|nr:glutamate receptor 2.7-like [Triticum dicoccoides]
MELPATRRLLVFLSLLTLWSITVDGASPAAAASAVAREATAPAPVRFGVGSRSLTCNSVEILDAFYLKQPSCANWADLRAKDSRGEAVAAAHAAEDLIKNAQVQAIIWGLQTLNNADHIPHLADHNNIPALSFYRSDAFWQEDPVNDSAGLTLGSNDTMMFLHPRTEKIDGMKLDTRNSRQDHEGQTMLKDFANVIYPIFEKQNISCLYGTVEDTARPVSSPLYNRLRDPHPSYRKRRASSTTLLSGEHYDELVCSVSPRMNLGVGGVPYAQSGASMIVLVKDEPYTISWTFVKPLSRNLWFATIIFFFYTGIVVWMIELPRNPEYQGSSLRQCSTALYFVFSTLTFSHGQIIRSPLSKIVVVIWCFVVLILIQSYTSSLSSILTTERLRPWVIDLDQLQGSGDFLGYQDDSCVRSFLMNYQNISESRLKTYTTKEEYAAALRKGSKNGGVSAIVGAIPYLTSFLSDSRYKDDFMMLGCIYTTPGSGFTFRLGFPLVQNHSTTILNLSEGVSDSQLKVSCFGTTSVLMGDDTVPDFGSAPLTLQNFSGLFIITGSISTVMILIAIVRLVYAKCTRPRNTDMESATDNSVEEDPRSMQNGLDDNPSPSQQLLHEAGEDNFQGVREGSQNDGGAQPDPVQQNVMHGGITPAGHFQIETNNV